MPAINKLRKMGLKKKYDHLLLLPLTTVILLFLCVVVFGLGIDKKMIKTSIQGQIMTNQNQPVMNAVICVETVCTITNQTGFYHLDNLPVGEKNITVSTDENLDVSQPIVLRRGSNSRNLTLTPAELTDATVKLSTADSILRYENLQVYINQKPYDLSLYLQSTDSVEIPIKRMKAGTYKLEIRSDYYVDQEIDLFLESDKPNLYSIVLEPAASIKIFSQDWLDLSPIPGAEIRLRDDNVQTTDSSGLLEIEEISVFTTELEITKEKYMPNTIVFDELIPGENPEKTVQLVPEGKIVFTKPATAGNQIFISNYDGSDLKQLTTEGDNKNPYLDSSKNKVFFTTEVPDGQSIVYSIDTDGEDLQKISSEEKLPSRTIDVVDYKNDMRVYDEKDEEGVLNIKSSKLDDSKTKALLKIGNSNLNGVLLSPDASQLVYGIYDSQDKSTDGIYTNILRFNKSSIVMKYGVPQALSYDGRFLAFTVENDVYVYNFANKSIQLLVDDDSPKHRFEFRPNDPTLTYLNQDQEGIELRSVNLNSKLSTKLSAEHDTVSDYRWVNEDIFSYTTSEKLSIGSVRQFDSPTILDIAKLQ